MKAIAIDFAPHSPWRLKLLTARGGLVVGSLLTALLLLGLGLQQLSQLQARAVELRANIAALTATIKPPASSAVVATPTVLPAARVRSVNKAITQLNLPWREILVSFERLTPKNIALLSIEPNGAKHTIKGEAETKAPEAMINYMQVLHQSKTFATAHLLEHKINEQDPERPLRFTFEVTFDNAEGMP